MNRDDALTITSMVANHWPSNHWNTDTLDAYARAIEPLDAEVTMRALTRCVNELEHYPKVSVLREYVKMEARKTEYDKALEEAAVDSQRMPVARPKRNQTAPDWVRGWFIARFRRVPPDFGVWPQQDPEGIVRDHEPDSMMSPEAQELYMEEGVGVPLHMILSAISTRVHDDGETL